MRNALAVSNTTTYRRNKRRNNFTINNSMYKPYAHAAQIAHTHTLTHPHNYKHTHTHTHTYIHGHTHTRAHM